MSNVVAGTSLYLFGKDKSSGTPAAAAVGEGSTPITDAAAAAKKEQQSRAYLAASQTQKSFAGGGNTARSFLLSI